MRVTLDLPRRDRVEKRLQTCALRRAPLQRVQAFRCGVEVFDARDPVGFDANEQKVFRRQVEIGARPGFTKPKVSRPLVDTSLQLFIERAKLDLPRLGFRDVEDDADKTQAGRLAVPYKLAPPRKPA